ncbi:hypothetical protein DE146DRAFT_653032 [Phaeosphaeria sp. MPI-PUGE-AT-0046c]|nr:hypothetical protein DE146DRAFT_653032 [Phaeosphaeria sp. MPI-PUGE-AT-0046c]
MALSALPAELKLSTIQYLDPESAFRFAMTCKEYATICRSVLKAHGQQLSQGRILDTTWGDTLLWGVLKEVLDDPSVGWYIRELNLPPTRQVSWADEHGPIQVTPSKEDKRLFRQAAQRLQDLYTPTTRFTGIQTRYPFENITVPNDMVTTIEERISQGFEDGILAILLHYLPFLHTIRITDSGTAGLQIFVRRIADEYQKPDRSPHLPLRHLKTAAVAHWDTEMGCDPDWAVSFCDIPSVTTFAAQSMADGSGFVTKDHYPNDQIPTSNVTELFFCNCQFDVEYGLAIILAGINNLKKFTYSGGGCTVSDSSCYNPKMVIRELVKYAAHSLEELVMDQGDIGQDLSNETDIPTVSLRGFRKLRILNIEYKLLRPMDTSDDVSDEGSLEEGFYTVEENKSIDDAWDVRTILPESLEEFYSYGEFDGDDGLYDEWDQVKDLFNTPSPMVPNLRLEKTCVRRQRPGYSEDVIGTAEEPNAIWASPLVASLFEGHGY